MNSRHLELSIIGAGPRGMSVLERLCAQERKSPSCERLTVHVVDPSAPGAGAVWRTGQSRHLLMNTVASQVTVFTDASVTMTGPIEEGPSLYEWAQRLLSGSEFLTGGPDETALAEARALGPDSYPTRAFYGHYLEWVFQRLVATAPAHVTVRVHASRAVALQDDRDDRESRDGQGGGDRGPQEVLLADGTRLTGLDAVVLAQGHVAAVPTRTEAELARFAAGHALTYLPPANPADVELESIRPGQGVAMRGMGLNFFDYMALFTLGRGGSFVHEGDRLVYRASGKEPRLYTGSRRGVPYHARGDNEKGAHGRYYPRLLTVERALALRDRANGGDRVHFGTDLWPLITKEVESVYYAALLSARGADGAGFADRYLHVAPGPEEERVLDEAGIGPADRWTWELVERPYAAREFSGHADFRGWLLDYLRADVVHARLGNVSGPVKAALDVLRDLRNEIRLAVDHGGLEGNSHRDELEGWYTPLNAFLSIGPPASRIEELIALIEAGIVEPTGPGMRVETVEDAEGAGFVVGSAVFPDVRLRATALIEARLPEPDLSRTADPLLRSLLDTGEAGPYRISGECGTQYETGGLAVSERPYRLLDTEGRPHLRRFAYGVPTESVHWVTAAGIRPGVGSVTLEDSDAIAAAALSLPPAREGRDDAVDFTEPVDSGILSPVRAGTPAEASTSDRAWLQAMLDAEAALARAQAGLSTLPAEAAAAITAAARADRLDIRALAVASRETANPVVGLVTAFTAVVAATDPEAAEYVHRGSTSQDILDTGSMLVAFRTLTGIIADLHRTAGAFARLAAEHRDTPQAGRTLALHAVPTTFGLKAAGWRQLVLDSADRLSRVRDGLPVSLGGAAGTLAGYLEYAAIGGGAAVGGAAPEDEASEDAVPGDTAYCGAAPDNYVDRLTAAYAHETGLAAPVLPWHSLRTPIADLGAALAHTAAALGKIALDVQVLSRTEIAEAAEPGPAGRGASSAMPHKRNPVLATLIRSAALQVPLFATVLTQSLTTEDERSAGAWHSEWLPLRECLRLTGGAAHTAVELAGGLKISPGRMRANLGLTASRIVSERIAAVLAPRLGKVAAKQLLTGASARADRDGLDLGAVLAGLPELNGVFSSTELAELLDPTQYTGAAGPLVDRSLRRGRTA